MGLDRHQSGDDADERRVTRLQLLPQLAAPPFGLQQRAQVEAERHGGVLLRATDAELEQLVSDAVGHGQQAIGPGGEAALDGAVDGGLGRREIPAQHVAVEGVHDHRHAAQDRGQAADGAGLGGVRVDDVGPHAANQPHQRPQGPQVAERPDLATEVGDDSDRCVAAVQRQVVALGGVLRAGHQRGREPRRIEPRARSVAWIAGPPMLRRAITRTTRITSCGLEPLMPSRRRGGPRPGARRHTNRGRAR